MITDDENYALKSLSEFLRRVTSKNDGDYYCINCLHSFRSANKLKSHEDYKDHDYCHANMLETQQYLEVKS